MIQKIKMKFNMNSVPFQEKFLKYWITFQLIIRFYSMLEVFWMLVNQYLGFEIQGKFSTEYFGNYSIIYFKPKNWYLRFNGNFFTIFLTLILNNYKLLQNVY